MPFGGSNKQQGDLHPQTFQFFHDGLLKFLISWLLRSALMSALLIRYIYIRIVGYWVYVALCYWPQVNGGGRYLATKISSVTACRPPMFGSMNGSPFRSVPYRPVGPSRCQAFRTTTSLYPTVQCAQLRVRSYAEDVTWRFQKHSSVEDARGRRHARGTRTEIK